MAPGRGSGAPLKAREISEPARESPEGAPRPNQKIPGPGPGGTDEIDRSSGEGERSDLCRGPVKGCRAR